MCPKCNFHNYRAKAVCPQCSTPQPPGGNPPPGYDEAEDDSSGKRKRTKWDDDEGKARSKEVPDWLQDLVPKEQQKPRPPPGVAPENYKILKMEGVQIRALIGKGGETIRDIRMRSGADIKIDHLPQDPEGSVTIVGEIEKTEQMIKDALAAKGFPLGVPKPSPVAALALGAAALPLGAAGLGGPPCATLLVTNPVDPNDVQVPSELVGPLIGPDGASIKEIRAKAGGAVYISLLPSVTPGGPQSLRIVGDHRESAKELILQKIEELMGASQSAMPALPDASRANDTHSGSWPGSTFPDRRFSASGTSPGSIFPGRPLSAASADIRSGTSPGSIFPGKPLSAAPACGPSGPFGGRGFPSSSGPHTRSVGPPPLPPSAGGLSAVRSLAAAGTSMRSFAPTITSVRSLAPTGPSVRSLAPTGPMLRGATHSQFGTSAGALGQNQPPFRSLQRPSGGLLGLRPASPPGRGVSAFTGTFQQPFDDPAPYDF